MSLVGIEDRGAVRHLVLQRAEKRNAFNGELISDLGHALEEAAATPTVRVRRGARRRADVLVGHGPQRPARPVARTRARLRPFRRPILSWWNLLEEMPKPTICQIHGACLGGAFELALAADFRVMAEDAMAGIMEVQRRPAARRGRLLAAAGHRRPRQRQGADHDRQGRSTATRRTGSASPTGSPRPTSSTRCTEALANELLAAAPRAVGLAKRVMDAAAKPALAATLEQEVQAQESLAATEDFAEGARAFFEKRPPEFAGR